MVVKVTIGICVRNEEKTIKKAVESVLHQDYPHNLMEVIFVDDGSSDSTLSIINDYVTNKMDVITKVFSGKWQGLGRARNIVVKNAKGDYIIWVDGDMVLRDDYVRKQVKFMEENQRVGLAGGKFGIFHGKNLIVALDNAEFLAKDYLFGKKTRSKPILYHLGFAGSILRVKSIEQVGSFNPNIKGAGEDVEIIHKITKAGWLIHTANEAIFYHRREDTLRKVWKQNKQYGYDYYFLKLIDVWNIEPKVLFYGILYPHIAYKLLHEKRVFLLIFYYYYKKLGWMLGFLKAHIDSKILPRNMPR